MWFLPLLLIGAIAVAVAKRSARDPAPPSRQLAAGPPGPPGLLRPPGPISVLGEILRIGQTPPPTVILCAIAEAQAIGRNDLASDIVCAFVAPVVSRHERARARAARPVYVDERGARPQARDPRHVAESPRPVAPPPPPSPFEATVPRTEAATPSAAAAPLAQPSAVSMDDEIRALLDADPVRFMDLVSRSGSIPSQQVPMQVPITPPSAVPVPTSAAPAAPLAQSTEMPSETLVQMQEAADRTRSLAPGSPILGVSDSAWRDFVVRLSRESPQFSSSRHVGQYRHRRERLAELGIDPNAILGSAQAQRAALDADLVDAHQHGVAGGLFAEHLGRPITLPGREGAETITLSGALGVIQCAGLEGAVGWLERSSDRKRYPHTTQAFLNTNGAF